MTIHLYSWEKSLVELAWTSPLTARWYSGAETVIGPALEHAYQTCEEITRSNSRSFSAASRFLPSEKRRAVRTLYAFCRITDDIVDFGGADARRKLAQWREAANQHSFPAKEGVLSAWLDTRIRHHIPHKYIEQFLEGVARDLEKTSYKSFEELAHYCYGVASTVGLMSMAIVGYTGPEAIPYAVRLGVALQLTNILRDVSEDWLRGRVYLPLDELSAHGVSRQDLAQSVLAGAYSDNWRAFMRFQIARARRLYDEAWPGIAMLEPDGRLAIGAAAGLYAGILDEIEAHDYDVFSRRTHVPDWKKLASLPAIMRRVRLLKG